MARNPLTSLDEGLAGQDSRISPEGVENYRSDDHLRAGKGFTIIELNGAASEATNIYDECNSLWSAYATLYRQWQLVYRIGAANRSRGNKPAMPFAVLRDWMEFSRRAVEFPIAD